MRDTYDVAIKKMFQVTVAKKDLETDSEIRFLQRARHPRLVMFLGCGYMDERKENIFLVLEFCDAGDYGTYLHHAEKERPWSERLLILQDVSEGIEYLHLVLRSIHRDLKSENILLRHEKRTNMLRAKIAGMFSLSLSLSLSLSTLMYSRKLEHAHTHTHKHTHTHFRLWIIQTT